MTEEEQTVASRAGVDKKIAGLFTKVLVVLTGWKMEDSVHSVNFSKEGLARIMSIVNKTNDANLSEKEVKQKQEINHYYCNTIEPMIEKYMSLKAFW